MPDDERNLLLSEISEHFLGLLEQEGFQRLAYAEPTSAEMRHTFPLGYLRRMRGGNAELLEVQFDKHGAAKFVVNFGVALPDGISLPWRKYNQNEVTVSVLPEWYRLYKNTRGSWFGSSMFDIFTGSETIRQKTISILLNNYVEIQDFFETRAIGPHVRRIGYPMS